MEKKCTCVGILNDSKSRKSSLSVSEKYMLHKITSASGINDYSSNSPNINIVFRFFLNIFSYFFIVLADLYLFFFTKQRGDKKK